MTTGENVVSLHYSAHPSAVDVLSAVVDEVAAAAQGVRAVAVSHRIGDLAVGDVAFVVAVSADHRRAVRTCADLVDEVTRAAAGVEASGVRRWSRRMGRDGLGCIVQRDVRIFRAANCQLQSANSIYGVRMRRRSISALLVALFSAALPIVAVQAPASAAPAACPDVEMVFARGTAEAGAPMGLTGSSFLQALQNRLPGKSVTGYAVNYPASSDFENHAAVINSVIGGVHDA